MNNIELFNGITGKVFADLYQSFPIEAEIKVYDYLEDFIAEDDYDGSWEFPEMTKATIKWLDKAGYIWLTEPQAYGGVYKATLTPKGLEVLKQVPNSIEPTSSIGEKIVEYSKSKFSEGMNEIVKTAISEGIKFAWQTAT